MLRNSAQEWGAIAITFHWLVATLVIAQFVLGWLAVAWRLSPTKLDLFVWHKSIGILVLALVVPRLAWRMVNRTPTLPKAMPGWEKRAARASHFALYVLTIALPLSGWIINSASNVPLRLFWLIPLPDLTGPDAGLEKWAKASHLVLFIALALLVVLHTAAALRHHFWTRDDVLLRMLPWRSRRP